MALDGRLWHFGYRHPAWGVVLLSHGAWWQNLKRMHVAVFRETTSNPQELD
jgi:hypothetical protein